MRINIKNLNTKSELVLSEESNIFVLEHVDWGVVEGVHGSVSNTDTVGEVVTSTFLMPRDVEIVGWILGKNQAQIQERKNILNKLINPQSQMQIEYGQYKLDVKAETTVRYGIRYQENNDRMCRFVLRFKAYQPLFMLKDELIKTGIAVASKLVFPLVFKPTVIFGAYPNESTSDMFNEGDVYAGFVIRLIMTGPVKNPMLNNNLTGEYFKLNFDAITGDVIEVSTLSGNKYVELIRGGNRSNIIGRLARGSVLFGMSPGRNSFNLLADENVGNMKIEFEYVPRFLEVQD
jgi:hypothetical protein